MVWNNYSWQKNDKVIIGICYDSPSNDEDKISMLYGDIYKVARVK